MKTQQDSFENGAIYFIHDPQQNAVKIGWSGVGPGSRLKAFNDARAFPVLTMIGCLPGGQRDERNLHALFGAHRIRNEWFAAKPGVMATIRMMLVQSGRPCTVEDELQRRNYCRFGLKGTHVAIAEQAAEPFEVMGSIWGAGTKLILKLRGLYAGETSPEIYNVPASKCYLLSEWPVACRCWCDALTADSSGGNHGDDESATGADCL